ncbi:MAG: penicillin acylase family protein, partial [Chitinophagaceae bacterium]
QKTKGDQSILVINPHINFFGIGQRYEAHLISAQGSNVSGFAIFGTFYIWSGFNEKLAWAHTNTGSDFQDVYLEKPDPADSTRYKYDNAYRNIITWQDTISYKTGEQTGYRIFTFRKTHHGPIVAKRDSLLVTVRSVLDDPAGYILQSLQMSKSNTLKEFETAMSLRQLTTNTMYSDAKGNIAYWHGSRIPVRDTSFNWRLPVDGSVKETEWKGYHSSKETIHFINPSSHYLQNCNSTPFLAAGGSVKKDNSYYPSYMAYDDQTLRAQEMLLQLSLKEKFNSTDIAEAITSKNIPIMRNWLSQIIDDYKKTAEQHPEIKTLLGSVIDTLFNWNYRYDLKSTATTLAFAWHTEYLSWLRSLRLSRGAQSEYHNNPTLPTPPGLSTQFLVTAVEDLTHLYGTPFVGWQEVCRLQRVNTSGQEKFDDAKFSIPVNAAPSIMGSLFAYNLRFAEGGKRGYGVSGNTYVAIVSFGKKMTAKSIVTFGQNSDPLSKHFFDQAPLYANAGFKEAWYYKKDVMMHAEEIYTPGKKKE